MAYFGNSTDQTHSILAGYQRRANQLQARSTSKYNLGVNLAGPLDMINDTYNNRLTKSYGDSKVLRDRVNTWADYSENEVMSAQSKLDQARDKVAELRANIIKLNADHDEVQKILFRINAGTQSTTDIASYGLLVQSIKKEIDSNYNVDNFESIRSKIQKSLDSRVVKGTKKQWLQPSDGKWEYASGTAMHDTVMAKEAKAEVDKVQDSVHLKSVEDFMVDGRLMRESKTALVITPLTAIAVVGVGLWAYRQFFRDKPINFGGNNKSAAVAVFG